MKYIDLRDAIVEDLHLTESEASGVDAAMSWLHMHPGQVPGRTITASEFDEAVESCITEDATVPPHKFAERLGVVCVPDPEPTNAERLEAHLLDLLGVVEAIGNVGVHNMAYELDRAGVKAPGGDDE